MNTTENRLRMQELWIRNNMSFLYRYWSTARAALESVGEAPERYEEFKDHKLRPSYVEAVLSNHFENHSFSGVLLTYAIFDEFLGTLTEDLGTFLQITIAPSDLKDRGVKRYQKFIHKVCAIDPNDMKLNWDFLEDFAIVRNCIIHGNGNKGRLGNPNEIDRVVRSHPEELGFKHKVRLVVSSGYVEHCMAATSEAALAVNTFMLDRL